MNKKSSPKSHILLDFEALLKGDVSNSKVMMFRYLLVAVVATLGDYALNVGVYTFLLELLSHWNHDLMTALGVMAGFAFGVWINYVLSVRWAFAGSESGKSSKDKLVFFVTALMGLGINIAVVSFLFHLFTLDPRIGRIPAILVAFLWNFYSKKWWVFKS